MRRLSSPSRTREPEDVSPPAPHLHEIPYRVGSRRSFLAGMRRELEVGRLDGAKPEAVNPLARMSHGSAHSLIASFLDATATVSDILSFYQERLVNDAFIETATQAGAKSELLWVLGAAPQPAVSASALLAFTVRGFRLRRRLSRCRRAPLCTACRKRARCQWSSRPAQS